MKTCSLCNTAKLESEFFYRNRDTGRLHAQCKACYAAKRRHMWRKHCHEYGSNYRERAVERNRATKNRLRRDMLEYLQDKACVWCGNNDMRVLEFDHIDPSTKAFTIARGITSCLSWESMLAEIAKCQILCANCHKIKTCEEGKWYKRVLSSP